MSDPSLIADLVRAGVDAELIGRVANAIAEAMSGGNRVDVSAEKRRAWDREYRRNKRENPPESTRIHPTSENALSLKEEDKEKKERGRASRIPPDWKPSEADFEFAHSKGMPHGRITTEAEKFRNYWTAKSGAAATKLDWPATWRNWVISSLERAPGNPPTPPPNATPEWKIPPWEREGLSESAWREREIAKTNGAAIRRNP